MTDSELDRHSGLHRTRRQPDVHRAASPSRRRRTATTLATWLSAIRSSRPLTPEERDMIASIGAASPHPLAPPSAAGEPWPKRVGPSCSSVGMPTLPPYSSTATLRTAPAVSHSTRSGRTRTRRDSPSSGRSRQGAAEVATPGTIRRNTPYSEVLGTRYPAFLSPCTSGSEIARAQTRSLGDPRQHARPNLLTGAEREHVLRPTVTRESLVRSRGTFDAPTDAQQGRQNPSSLDGWPSAHAAANWMVFGLGEGSPCSSRSATTRSANAFARLVASSRLSPYAMTPGSSMTSAIQRPSSSRSVSIVNRICLAGSVRRETLATPRTGTSIRPCGRGESVLLGDSIRKAGTTHARLASVLAPPLSSNLAAAHSRKREDRSASAIPIRTKAVHVGQLLLHRTSLRVDSIRPRLHDLPALVQ